MKKHAHRRGIRGTSYKTLGFAAAAGVAAVVGLGFLQTKVEAVRTHWYYGPLGLAAGGFLLSKKMPTIAIAMVAAAGVFGYIGYQANADAQASAPPPKTGAAGFGYHPGAGQLRMSVRQDSGMYENAGALQGRGASRVLAQQAGTLLGAGSSAALRSAGGLSD